MQQRKIAMVKQELKDLHELKQLYQPVADEMLVNMGPQHPSTHGVLNFLLVTDGEVMHKAVAHVGYLHRGIEKIGEAVEYNGFVPFTDRVDYLAAMSANQGFAMAVEKLASIQVPERAEYLRVIATELNRIASHLVANGAMAMDIGAFTPFVHWLKEREFVNDLMEELCGARLTYNYIRIGGVAFDCGKELAEKIVKWIDHFEPMVDEFDRLITNNEIFVQRLANVSPISAEEAMSYNLVGPNLRASGVDWDIRRDVPYSVYSKFDFKIPVGKGFRGTVGDCYDRFVLRILEIRESCKILRQALATMPEGEIMAKVPKTIKPPKGEAIARVESARGELFYYVVSDGSSKPLRVKIRAGSFTAMSIIEHLSKGVMIADLVAIIGSLDVVAPEVDR